MFFVVDNYKDSYDRDKIRQCWKKHLLRGIAWVGAGFYVENPSQTEVRILWIGMSFEMSWIEFLWVILNYKRTSSEKRKTLNKNYVLY